MLIIEDINLRDEAQDEYPAQQSSGAEQIFERCVIICSFTITLLENIKFVLDTEKNLRLLFTKRSREVSEPWDWTLKLHYRSEIWLMPVKCHSDRIFIINPHLAAVRYRETWLW